MRKTLTQKDLNKIAKRIAEGAFPQKVVLFGSYAWGKPHPGSDVDLLVILNSSLPRRERRHQVSNLLRPRPAPMDLFVYTPEEISKALRIKGSFVKEVMNRGKILYEEEVSYSLEEAKKALDSAKKVKEFVLEKVKV